jgi:hypothetical protein
MMSRFPVGIEIGYDDILVHEIESIWRKYEIYEDGMEIYGQE